MWRREPDILRPGERKTASWGRGYRLNEKIAVRHQHDPIGDPQSSSLIGGIGP